MSAETQRPVAFGPFRLDPRNRSLTRAGAEVQLGRRAFDLLCALAAAGGDPVSKETLLDRVWPGLTVEENNLQVQISALRKALGDGMIATVPSRGYRLTMVPSGGRSHTAGKPSIAVLPFINMSGDIEQEYFADGVADDIITELARVRSLFVIARNSSFAYRGRAVDVRQISSELGVRYLLEGSVRRDADRLRVIAQLVDAETGSHLWANRYDSLLQDLFSLQDEIALAVVRAISPALTEAEQSRALRKPLENLGAWEAYQRGLWHARKATADDNRQALEFFRRAAELDPTFASPHAMLAYCYGWGFAAGGLLPVQDISNVAEQAARRAIGLDPDDTTALAALAWLAACDGHPADGLERAEQAIAVAPNDAVAWEAKARVLQFSGRPRDALAAYQVALRLSPVGPSAWIVRSGMFISHYFAGDYHATVEGAQRTIRDHPLIPRSYRWLAAALGQLGQDDAARTALLKAIELSSEQFNFYARSRPPWFRPEDHEHMLAGLRKAGWEG